MFLADPPDGCMTDSRMISISMLYWLAFQLVSPSPPSTCSTVMASSVLSLMVILPRSGNTIQTQSQGEVNDFNIRDKHCAPIIDYSLCMFNSPCSWLINALVTIIFESIVIFFQQLFSHYLFYRFITRYFKIGYQELYEVHLHNMWECAKVIQNFEKIYWN